MMLGAPDPNGGQASDAGCLAAMSLPMGLATLSI